MHIGSRPARRSGTGELQTLRAIPWQFAWMQTRLLLPSWLGVEELVSPSLSDEDRDVCRDDVSRVAVLPVDDRSHRHGAWPRRTPASPSTTIVSSFRPIRDLGQALRDRLRLAIRAVLLTTGHRDLLDDNPVLRRSIDVRNPYVDPINLVQVEVLRRLRSQSSSGAGDDPQTQRLRRALLVTINGIAAGMRNTG